MRDAFLVAAVAVLSLTVVAAAALAFATPRPQATVLSEDVTFPDYSTGAPGLNSTYAVWFHVTIATTQPWVQGVQQNPVVTVVAEPGSQVTDVNVTTFFLDLGRVGVPGFLTGDFDLTHEVAADRWQPVDGPMRIWPDADVAGSDLYLTFQISLSVQYVNGSGYGFGHWNPAPRLPVTIVPDPMPWGIAAILAGGSTGTLLLVVRRSRGVLSPAGRRDTIF